MNMQPPRRDGVRYNSILIGMGRAPSGTGFALDARCPNPSRTNDDCNESNMMPTKAIPTITPHELAERKSRGQAIHLIDVRTPVEYEEVHVQFAQNVPLDRLNPMNVLAGHKREEPLYVICRSGNRAAKACEAIFDSGFDNVVNVAGGTQGWEAAGLPVTRGKAAMSLERQVRIAAGSLVLVGVLLAYFSGNIHFVWLSAFIGAGLVFSGITDTCGMGMLLARMPWNQVTLSGDSANEAASSAQSERGCCG
jgi:rhodanese-related sulfurtransferase